MRIWLGKVKPDWAYSINYSFAPHSGIWVSNYLASVFEALGPYRVEQLITLPHLFTPLFLCLKKPLTFPPRFLKVKQQLG